jgi:Domain of unknown function (DUF6285)
VSGRHAVPTARELAEALREFLEEEVMPAVDGRLRFLARVAANASAQIERELALGPEHARAHSRRLRALGVADDAELVRAIRTGALDDRLDQVLAVTRASAVNKLRIANPRYLRPEDRET